MEKSQVEEKITEVLSNIFEKCEIQSKLEFPPTEEERQILVNIKSTEDSLLIGYHGNTLRSIQHILDAILFKHFQQNFDVLVDVGDYREERKNKILQIAESAVEKARVYKKAVALYPMSAYERKLVHEYVSQTEDLVSSSEGEGRDRRVIISFKDK